MRTIYWLPEVRMILYEDLVEDSGAHQPGLINIQSGVIICSAHGAFAPWKFLLSHTAALPENLSGEIFITIYNFLISKTSIKQLGRVAQWQGA